MIKMRAVPDDFDNVQALHSPYGAVHGLGTPITSPVDFGASSYTDPMMRPLMVDVRRHGDGDDHLSPTGLSPAFGSIGFNPSATLSTPDILSPLSPASSDRYGYPSHLSGGPLSSGARTNPFARQPSLDTSMQMHNHPSRQQIRPLQPLHLRDAMSRSRSDTLQSPLRTSMSWKGDSLDYTTYHGGNASPQMGTRPQGLYSQDTMSSTTTSGMGGYDSSSYSGTTSRFLSQLLNSKFTKQPNSLGSTVQSPTHMSYSGFQSSSLQAANQQRNPRMRSSSAASLPLGLDLRTQYRSAVGSGAGGGLQTGSTHHSPGGAGSRTASTPGLGGGVSSSYTASFPSAPLSAPIDFSLPRTSGYRSSGAADYSMSQMSAPIAPPNDFSQAFQSMSTRTPMRDSFSGGSGGSSGGGVGSGGLGSGLTGSGSNNNHNTSTTTDHRTDDYGSSSSSHHHHHSHHDPLGMKRKRSFTAGLGGGGGTPSTTTAGGTASGIYGSAT